MFAFDCKFVLGRLLVCFALASCTFWEVGCRDSRPGEPRDQELISIFQAHRQLFEQVGEMATEDARRGWYLGVSDPTKLDQSRRDEYEKLVTEIGPRLHVGMNGNSGVVRFIFAEKGSAIGPGWAKGIEYLPGDYKKEGVLSTNLDDARNRSANVYILQIQPRWFVFYQRDE